MSTAEYIAVALVIAYVVLVAAVVAYLIIRKGKDQ
jgi:Tfp pilus assembly protein PilW